VVNLGAMPYLTATRRAVTPRPVAVAQLARGLAYHRVRVGIHLLTAGVATQPSGLGAGRTVVRVGIRGRVLRVLELDPHYDAPVPLPPLMTHGRSSVGFGIRITVGHADATAYVCSKPIY